MKTISRVGTFLSAVLCLTAGWASVTEESLAGRVAPLYIRPEPHVISPGAPLSVRSLAPPRPLPACLAGAQVWVRSHHDLFTCRTRRQGPEASLFVSRSRQQDSLTCLTSRQGSKM